MKEQQGSAVAEQAAESASQRAGKYLTFKLAHEEYGIEILKVKEIIGVMSITRVPRTPDFIRGVINLRGKVIPVMELRVKFEMESVDDTDETCIIVVDVALENRSVIMGVLVDSVSEVLNVAEEEIEDAPSFGENVNTDFILGMGKTKGRVIILLNIDKVLEAEELKEVSKAAAGE